MGNRANSQIDMAYARVKRENPEFLFLKGRMVTEHRHVDEPWKGTSLGSAIHRLEPRARVKHCEDCGEPRGKPHLKSCPNSGQCVRVLK